MSKMKVINKIIKDNYKINEIKETAKDNIRQEENSFNQLLSLQLLIQKHSGLKEMCKFFIK